MTKRVFTESESTFLKGLMTPEEEVLTDSQFEETYLRSVAEIGKQFGYDKLPDEAETRPSSESPT